MSGIEGPTARSLDPYARARCEARLAHNDEQTALAFLTTAFGVREQARCDGLNVSIMVSLEFGHSTLMISPWSPEHHDPTPLRDRQARGRAEGQRQRHRRTLLPCDQEGAQVVTELENTFWGHRRCEALDPEGNRCHIMRELL